MVFSLLNIMQRAAKDHHHTLADSPCALLIVQEHPFLRLQTSGFPGAYLLSTQLQQELHEAFPPTDLDFTSKQARFRALSK